MMRDTTINPGDKFTSVENPRTVWIVVREAVLAQAMPPHFQLAHPRQLLETDSRSLLAHHHCSIMSVMNRHF